MLKLRLKPSSSLTTITPNTKTKPPQQKQSKKKARESRARQTLPQVYSFLRENY